MRRAPGTVALLLAAVTCGEPVAPATDALTVRIAGPDTVGPRATVTLAGSAERTFDGAVSDSTLTWYVGDSLAHRGPHLRIPMGDAGATTVRLSVAVAGDTGEAVHTITVIAPGAVLWRVDLQQGTDYPLDVAAAPSGRVFAGTLFRRAFVDPGPVLVSFQSLGSSPGGQPFAVRPDGGYLHNTGSLTAFSAAGDSLWSYADAEVYYYAVTSTGAVRFFGPQVIGGLSSAGAVQWADTSSSFGGWRGIAGDGAGRSYVLSGTSRLDVYDSVGTPLAGGLVALPATCNAARDVVPVGNSAVLITSRLSFTTHCLSRVDWSTRAVEWTWMPGGSIGGVPPAVASDGSIFIALQSGSIIHLADDGSQLWRSVATTDCPDTVGAGTPALGLDGTVFTVAGGQVTSVGADGTVRWTTEVAAGNTASVCDAAAPSLTHDGRLIVMRPGFVVAALAAGSSADTTAIWNQWRGGPERHHRANAQ